LRLRRDLERESGLKLGHTLAHRHHRGHQTSVFGHYSLDAWGSGVILSGGASGQDHLLRVTMEALSILGGRWRVPSKLLRASRVLLGGAFRDRMSAGGEVVARTVGVECVAQATLNT
jgi:hypothetical protein